MKQISKQLPKEYFDLDRLTEADLIAFKQRYDNDPVLFAQEILGIQPDENQIKIIEAIRDNDYVAVSSGRGIGKTISLSIIASWSIATKARAKVLVTSNTDAQSKATLWAPLVSILRNSSISNWFEYTTELINFIGDKETAFIKRLVWSESNVEAVSGYHGEHMIYLCDEASKYPNAVIENLYASCTESWNKMLLTSNPTRTTGYFHDTQEKSSWTFLEIDSRTSLHTDKQKIQELIDEYGEDSDVVRVQVLGKFPRMGSSSIVAPDIVAASINGSKPPEQTNDVVSIGWDIGGQGDPNVWVVRRGKWVEHVESMYGRDDDPEPLISKTIELVEKYKAHRLTFDKTGMGYYFQGMIAPRLPRALGCIVNGVQFGDPSPVNDCVKKRDWIYRRVRDWMSQGGLIGPKPKFKEQLLATEYVIDNNGKIKLIPKKLIKEAIGQSPDEADALALSCAYDGDLNTAPLRAATFNTNQSLGNRLAQAGAWH